MNWKAIAKNAKKAIAKYGAPITMGRETAAGYDSVSGEYSSVKSQKLDTKAIFSVPKDKGSKRSNLEKKYDAQFLLSASGLEWVADSGDTVTMGGVQYTVDVREPIAPGGEAVLYLLHCTK